MSNIAFSDIRTFVEIANDPQKFKKVIDQLDQREKQFQDLLQEVTEAQGLEKFRDQTNRETSKAKAEADAMMQTVIGEKKKLEEEKLKQKENLLAKERELLLKESHLSEQEKQMTADRQALNDRIVKYETLLVDAQRLEQERERLVKEYQEKLDKLNAVLK